MLVCIGSLTVSSKVARSGRSGRSSRMFEGLKIIDSDTHWSEPYDLWTSRSPAKFAEDVPRVVERANGSSGWIFQGKPLFGLGSGSQIDRKGFKIPDAVWKGG